MPIDDEIKKGEKALKQLNEIKEEMNKNPLDITGNIKDRMKEVEDQLRKLKNVSTENIDEVKKLTEGYKELAKTKESLEGLEKAIRGIGTALGIALPQLKALEIVMFIAQTVFDWSENLAKVNKQMYDIGANLGHMGDKSSEIYAITAKGTDSLAWKFKVTNDEVRDTIGGLTKIGFGMGDIEGSTEKVLALSKLWSEYTPQEQTRIMSKYMKEFGMEGDQAQKVMIGIVNLANDLKGIMPKLDAKEFASQIQDVSVSMRKYGLETSDAIGLTATLTKLGIDQARIPELAKGIGGIGMEDPAIAVDMMKNFRTKLEADNKEFLEIKTSGEKGQLEGIKKLRYEHLKEEEASRLESLKKLRDAEGNVLKEIGTAHTLAAGELAKAQINEIDVMFKRLGYTGGLAKTSVEETIGLIRMNAPAISGLGVAGGEALVGRFQELQSGKALTQQEGETKETFVKRVEEDRELKELLKRGGPEAVLTSIMKEWNEGKIKTLSQEQLEQSKTIATATKDMKGDVSIIKDLIGSWFTFATKGDKEISKNIIGRMEAQNIPITKEGMLERGVSLQVATETIAMEESHALKAARESSKYISPITREAKKAETEAETYRKKAMEDGTIASLGTEEWSKLSSLEVKATQAQTQASRAIMELTEQIKEQFKDIPMTFTITASGDLVAAIKRTSPNGS